MNTLLLVVLFGINAIGLASAVGLFCKPESTMRMVTGTIFCLWLLGFAAFCAFGFLASFEPPIDQHRPWQIGYAIVGLGALAGSLLALRRVFQKAPSMRRIANHTGEADAS